MSLAYASHSDEDDAIPIAVVFAPSDSSSHRGPVVIRAGWQERVKESHQTYIEDILEEWAQSPAGVTEAMMSRLVELSVGPIRSVEVGECGEDELIQRAETFLGPSFQRLT